MGTDRSLSSRNYGVDLLRVVAMLYVVTLHSIGPGGILAAAQAGSAQYHTAWFLEIWTYCAVDIFALISGYVSYSDQHKPVRWSNYLLLWLQVVFYGAGVTLAFNFFHPELVTRQDLFQTFFHKFTMGAGYSFLWISILYVLGACVKKCGIGKNLKPWQAVFGIVVLCLVTWWWKMYGPEFDIWKNRITKDLLVSYVSPTVLGCALLHLIWFSKLTFGPLLRRLISFAAPAAFAAYILNCHKLVWAHVVANQFAWLAAQPLPVLVGYVVLFSLVFVGVSVLIDRIRIALFDLLRLRKAADRLTASVDRVLTKLTAHL